MMTIRSLVVGLIGAAITAATFTAVTIPLARGSGLERPSVSTAERVTGFTVTSVVIMGVLYTPVLFFAGRLIRRRPARGWLAIAPVILVFLVFMSFPVVETGSLMPMVWNVQGWIARPVEFAADWLPFFAAAAVFGLFASAPTYRGANGQKTAV